MCVNGQSDSKTSVYNYPLSHRYGTEGRGPQLRPFENIKTCVIGLNSFCEDFDVKEKVFTK